MLACCPVLVPGPFRSQSALDLRGALPHLQLAKWVVPEANSGDTLRDSFIFGLHVSIFDHLLAKADQLQIGLESSNSKGGPGA